ncbi:hypothetical protein AOXY_G13283 [Acipenser oxyrinchus oxyrinchus]|uniref:RRM domain-containing protein n=1 Tax=Acipenser oxyrinchus oxyrinchus TaxID=40147 RepID=A0AAD8G3L5_ACIOX|nr:hypothetical protein AOXY_G13283 [Acipenser oxyrinchus oxyrinchus]
MRELPVTVGCYIAWIRTRDREPSVGLFSNDFKLDLHTVLDFRPTLVKWKSHSVRCMWATSPSVSGSFAFVDFANQKHAQQAISRLNGSVYEGRRIIVRSAYTSRVSSHECTTFETKVKELRVKEESNGCSACSCKEAMGGRRLFARHDVEMVSDQEDENQFGLKTAVKKEKLEEQKMLLEIKKFEIEIQKLQLEIRKL